MQIRLLSFFMKVVMVILLSCVQFGLKSSEWLTKSEDQEVNDTQSCYQFIKTMTTSKKQFSHRLCVFVKKKNKTQKTPASQRGA